MTFNQAVTCLAQDLKCSATELARKMHTASKRLIKKGDGNGSAHMKYLADRIMKETVPGTLPNLPSQ